MPQRDISILNGFLKEFVDEVTEKHSEKIDFIILSGSASRGDFQLGKSDLDLGIRVKRQDETEIVRRDATDIFWNLDSKHSTNFRKALEVQDSDALFPFLSKRRPKDPFQVYGPNYNPRKSSLFWKLNFIHGYGKVLLTQTLKYGRILYGNNAYLEELAEKEKYVDNSWDTFFTFNLLLSLAVMPIFIISPDYALKRSVKAVFYTFDGSEGHKNAKRAAFAKFNFKKIRKEWSYFKKAVYCLKAPVRIARHNFQEVLKRRKKA